MLPKYKGKHPVERAITDGEKEIGVTAHFVNHEWDSGETTQCISVDIRGPHRVAITDAHGCEAMGSGIFSNRDCEGLVSHTSVNCGTFQDGTGDGLSSDELNVQVTDNIITGIAPGVFFYWTFVTAPSANFTVNLVQTKSNLDFPYFPLHGGQIVIYDGNCNNIGSGYETSQGQAVAEIAGAEIGEVFIISVKYNLKAIIGTYMHPSSGCQYDFMTVINGVVVDQDPDGLMIGTIGIVAVGDPPSGGTDFPGILRPMPNPFRDGMQMAYAVGSQPKNVSIRVYNVAGRLVRTLEDGTQPVGLHVVEWDGRDNQGSAVRKGLYFVHVRIGNESKKVRVTFLR